MISLITFSAVANANQLGRLAALAGSTSQASRTGKAELCAKFPSLEMCKGIVGPQEARELLEAATENALTMGMATENASRHTHRCPRDLLPWTGTSWERLLALATSCREAGCELVAEDWHYKCTSKTEVFTPRNGVNGETAEGRWTAPSEMFDPWLVDEKLTVTKISPFSDPDARQLVCPGRKLFRDKVYGAGCAKKTDKKPDEMDDISRGSKDFVMNVFGGTIDGFNFGVSKEDCETLHGGSWEPLDCGWAQDFLDLKNQWGNLFDAMDPTDKGKHREWLKPEFLKKARAAWKNVCCGELSTDGPQGELPGDCINVALLIPGKDTLRCTCVGFENGCLDTILCNEEPRCPKGDGEPDAASGQCKLHNDGLVWLFCQGAPVLKWGMGLEGRDKALANCNFHHRAQEACHVQGKCRMHQGTVWLFCNNEPSRQWGVGPEGWARALGNCNFHHQGDEACRAEMVESFMAENSDDTPVWRRLRSAERQ